MASKQAHGEDADQSGKKDDRSLTGNGKQDLPLPPAPASQVPAPFPPIPPGPSNQALQVAVGMQFIQQSAFSFHQLEKNTQKELLTIVSQMDRHAFENAQTALKYRHEKATLEMNNMRSSLADILRWAGILVAGGLITGGVVTVMLIRSGQPQLAHTVIMSSLAVISALLGGAGLSSLLRNLRSPKKEE